MRHTLICSKGGLIITHHNEVRDEILYLARQAFTSASVCAKPLVNKGHTILERGAYQGSDKGKDTREDVLIRVLWYQQAYSIIDFKLDITYANSYKYEPMADLLAWW